MGSRLSLFSLLLLACNSATSVTPFGSAVSDEVCDALLASGVTFERGQVEITKSSGGTTTLDVEIAETSQQTSQGLMCRATVPDGTGMLFLFSSDRTTGFWMKNTYVALDIAYIDADGVIVDILQMEPCTAPLDENGNLTGEWPAEPEECVAEAVNYVPSQSYRQALEIGQGYLLDNGVTVGDRIVRL